MTTPTRGGKRKGSGRKPMDEDDKKIRLTVWPVKRQIDKMGGLDKACSEVMKFIERKSKQQKEK